jgi:transposase-like protein
MNNRPSLSERRWLVQYKMRIACGKVCPECDSTTSIDRVASDTIDSFFCHVCAHTWDEGIQL